MQDFTGREEIILEQALQLPSGEQSAYLEKACGGNTELRRRVDGLIAARRQRTGMEDSPSLPEYNEWPTDMPRPAVVGQSVGPYKLLQEIGEGGGGKVFLAEQEQPVRRRVALKIIKLGMDTEEVIARFEAERQALAMMDHPNIARVYDAGATETGRPYFVMELVRGVPITQFCDEQKLSVAERLQLFILVCNAVQHAHQKGIIHRDIKPSNILVSMNDGVPTPKVIDFGIAKATGGRLTEKPYYTAAEQFVGTPAYMSPEQAALSNEDVDTRSDIYSLGVLLYQLLTGRTPLDQDKLHDAGVDEVRRAIREDEPPRPSTRLGTVTSEDLTTTAGQRHTDPARLVATLRGDLDWIVMRCLEKDRSRRYETASALAQDLQHYLANEPVSARPPSAMYLLQKMARRHRVMFVSVTAITAALVLGLGAAIWSAYEASVQRDRADEQMALAQKAEKETALALGRTDYLVALDLTQEDRMSEAVAHLVRALRASPDNPPAAALLNSILTMRNWAVPLAMSETTATNNFAFGRRGQNGLNRGAFPGGNPPPAGARGPVGRGPAQSVSVSSPDGSWNLKISGNTAELVDTTKPVDNQKPIALPNVQRAAFSPDSRWLFAFAQDRSVSLWDVKTGQRVSMPLRMEDNVVAAEISADGKTITTKSQSNGFGARGRREVTETWSLAQDAAVQKTFPTATAVSSITESSDEKFLLTVSNAVEGNTAQVWNLATGQPVGETMKIEQARTGLFTPDGKRVVTSSGNALQIWDPATGKPVGPPVADENRGQGGVNRPGTGRGGLSSRISFSADGKRILFMGSDRTTLHLLDAATGAAVTPAPHQEQDFNSAAFSPDGARIVTAGASVEIWDVASGNVVAELAKDAGPFDSAQFSPDGKQILTTTATEAQVWDIAADQAVGEAINQDDQALTASFSPDGSQILTITQARLGATERAARVWDAATGQAISAQMLCDGSTTAVFSADGHRIFTTGASARVWDAATGLALSVPMTGREVKFSSNGQRVFVLGTDWVVRSWPVSENIGPPWILDLAETLAQCQLDKTGSLVFYPGKPLEALRRQAEQEKEANQPMVEWAKKLLGVVPTTGK